MKFNEVLHLGWNTTMHQNMMGATQLESSVFSMRATKHWNRWHREVVESPFLETFKSHLDMVLGSLL